jgi:hypothetical protein
MSGTTVTSTLVWNEQTKLVANALDRASTAIGVGSLFPLWQLYKGGAAHVLRFAASAYISYSEHCCFIFGALLLHSQFSEGSDDGYGLGWHGLSRRNARV